MIRARLGRARLQTLAIVAGLIGLTWGVFGRTIGHEFINYDDQTYVYHNSVVQKGLSWDGVRWAFTHTVSHNWQPLTILSHMADCQVYRLNPAGHHFTSVLLHSLAVVLLFGVLRQLTGATWRSAFVAALFAVHPLRAESVAWIAERKDVLSALFFVLTLGAYARYARARSISRYLAVALFFALGLMCKGMLVTTPLILLLVDHWPLARCDLLHRQSKRDETLSLGRAVAEKLPLFVLAAGGAVAVIIAQQTALRPNEELPFWVRLANAGRSAVIYVWETVWPVDLAPFYPFAARSSIAWWGAGALILLIGVTVAAVWFARKKQEAGYLFTGWMWYLVMLLPVLGLLQVGVQAHADRYTYLPGIGLFLLLAWGVPDLTQPFRVLRKPIAAGAIAMVALLAVSGYRQTGYWHDSQTLWQHAIAVTGSNSVAETCLTDAYVTRGRYVEAVEHGALAIKIDPRSADAHNNYGVALGRSGKLPEAIDELRTVVELAPQRPLVHFNLGTFLLQAGRAQDAVTEFEKELAAQPNNSAARNSLGMALSQTGALERAVEQWQRATEQDANDIDARANLGWVLATSTDDRVRNPAKAIVFAREAVERSHQADPRLLRVLAVAYAAAGQFDEATETAKRAKALAEQRGNTGLVANLTEAIDRFSRHEPLRDGAGR